jgi:hypothetical protein
MASWDDVRRVASALPEVVEADPPGHQWRVRGKLMAWERPLRKADLTALGIDMPDEPILGVRVPDESEKLALVAADPDVYLTTPHFDGYPAVVVWLDRIATQELAELLLDAWLVQAPKRLAAAYLADRT